MGYVEYVRRLCYEMCINEKNRRPGESFEKCVDVCMESMIDCDNTDV